MPLGRIPFNILLPQRAQNIIIRRLRLRPTKPTQDLLHPLHKPQPRKFLHNPLVLLPRQCSLARIRSAKIEPDSETARRDLGLLVSIDADNRVQRNGVPDQLHATRIPLRRDFALEEVARCDGAVDFEALVWGDQRAGVVPAQVVQEGADGVHFEVHVPEGRDLGCDDDAEEPGAHFVVEGQVVAVGAGKGDGGGDGGRVGDGDAGEDAGGEGG